MLFRSLDGRQNRELEKKVRERKVAMLVPHFLAVPNIMADTDFLCIVPRQLGQAYMASGRVRIVSLPFDYLPFTVSQFWLRRFNSDPGNFRLRDTIRRLFRRASRTKAAS